MSSLRPCLCQYLISGFPVERVQVGGYLFSQMVAQDSRFDQGVQEDRLNPGVPFKTPVSSFLVSGSMDAEISILCL